MTAARPASPESWVPGATCCHRNRKRMRSCAVAGCTRSRRDPAGVAVHAGQETTGHPLGRQRRRRCSGPEAQNPPAAARPGPPPPGSVANAVAPDRALDRRDAAELQMTAHHAGGGRIVAVERQAGLAGRLGGGPQLVGARGRMAVPGPASAVPPTSGAIRPGPGATREDSRSCRSSACRGSGRSPEWTCSMASGSRAPMELRSTLRPRRSRTALVRRFWNSSSSRKA